ncbi:hypothetical protein KSF_078900 [Reticulibacter mediterranei]|uniref:Uncharacterized protein n=1 Tax=Reticulibacter mediterranei TaxID=2778369 RepID=A0A8J3IW09_9CHLR|nr:hypothetical protein [Reticulibacter mediterranei]GHO97842.1 hypothetical protein KSF_078900 [Reticulibacter mediterranei]
MKKFFKEHFTPRESDPSKEGDKGKKGGQKEEKWMPMHDPGLGQYRAESSRTGGLREGFGRSKEKEAKLIRREGEVAEYVPEEFHNRKLLATTNERSNCGIHAILISDKPDLSIQKGVETTKKVRSDLIKDSKLPPEAVMPGKPLDLSTLGEAILDKMSKYIGENRGLIIHYSHGIEGDDHQVVREGKEPINIYLDRRGHYWGMGPEIEPGAWKPNPATSGRAIMEASRRAEEEWQTTQAFLQAEEERLLAEALERSTLEQ